MFALLSTIETFLQHMVNEYPVTTHLFCFFLEHLIKGAAAIVKAEFKKKLQAQRRKKVKKAKEKDHVATAQQTKKAAEKAWRCTPRRKRKNCNIVNQTDGHARVKKKKGR